MVAIDSGGRYVSVEIAVFDFAAGICSLYPDGNLCVACYLVLFCGDCFIIERTLTLRRLKSYIYIYMEHPFLMFLDHTQRRSTVGRTPLDE